MRATECLEVDEEIDLCMHSNLLFITINVSKSVKFRSSCDQIDQKTRTIASHI